MLEEKDSIKKKIEVLYDDDSFIVFNKPANLLVIPSPKEEANTLVSIVNAQYIQEDKRRLYPCHRLDQETSGVIIFAKGKKNQQVMMQVFKEQKVDKKYTAFVYGQLKKEVDEIKRKIKSFDAQKYRRYVQEQSAVTRYRVLEKRKYFSVVEAVPVTGRTNQIRIHFMQIGHPLVGDRKYARIKDFPVTFRRAALHAGEISWISPSTGKKINVKCPLPNDMEVFLARN